MGGRPHRASPTEKNRSGKICLPEPFGQKIVHGVDLGDFAVVQDDLKISRTELRHDLTAHAARVRGRFARTDDRNRLKCADAVIDCPEERGSLSADRRCERCVFDVAALIDLPVSRQQRSAHRIVGIRTVGTGARFHRQLQQFLLFLRIDHLVSPIPFKISVCLDRIKVSSGSVIWSYPSRCRTPCTVKNASSRERECPYSAACSLARS